MNRRSFFATLTAIGAVTVLPKVKPKVRHGYLDRSGKFVDHNEAMISALEKSGIEVNRELWYGKDEMHL